MSHLYIAVVGLFLSASAIAQEPVENVSKFRHANIAAAQVFTRQAFNAMTAAQVANEYDLGGHASKAKKLLDQAADEMKQAAVIANQPR